MNKEKIIQVEKLTKTFGDFTAVKGITFDVYKGEIFGFLGANGAGKTTAMKMLIGISTPTSGSAIWKISAPGTVFSKRRQRFLII